MKVYLDLLKHVLENGTPKSDRTGVGTLSLFGHHVQFDLSQGFPILTTKKIHFKSVVHELLWFLSGDTNTAYLNQHGVTIWDEWADQSGNLGPIYSKQWRRWQSEDNKPIDQISNAISLIKRDPDSRRIVVSAWNVAELDQMALPPCHTLFQFYVANNKLSCHLFQRSCDLFLGWSYNVSQYSLLTHMIAQQCDLQPGRLAISYTDLHLYAFHKTQALTQLARTPYPLPTLKIHRRPETIFDYRFEDFELINYQAHPSIQAPVAV